MDFKLEMESIDKICTICGANNVGKTNILRAINCFFNPETYIPSKDCPNHKWAGSRGGKVFPEISIEFISPTYKYEIKREFDIDGLKIQEGKKTEVATTTETALSESDINSLISKIPFYFIPSINISTPELINSLIEDVYDIEYEKTRFRGLKQTLKESFEKYIEGILVILNTLAEEINPIFEEFNENWQVGFEFTSDVRKFRDLISSDIDFYLNDKSNRQIDSKGSGLQRLGFILLHSRIIDKLSKKNAIILIDEPDVYIHQGLQKKLYDHLKKLTAKSQIILTSHSPVFIDSYTLENVFLIDLEIGDPVYYKRAKKELHPLKTTLVDLEEESGFKKIRDYLGIELDDYELLDTYNVMVEGDADKKYITETSKFFGIDTANIIPTHGVTNFIKSLEFYNSFYNGKEVKPKIRVIFDNDGAGRDEYRKIFKKNNQGHFQHIEVSCEFVPNYLGEIPNHDDVMQNRIHSNIEIEDLIYPKVFVSIANKILGKRNFNKALWSDVKNKIQAPAFKDKGILYNFDLVKNEANPTNGHTINYSSDDIKKGIANLYKLRGDKATSKNMAKLDIAYPEFKNYLEKISKPD